MPRRDEGHVGGRREASPVVFDVEARRIGGCREPHPYAPGAGVALDVAQCLLNDAKEGRLDLGTLARYLCGVDAGVYSRPGGLVGD